MVESLWRETQGFGIQTLLIQPGRFRTLLLSDTNRRDNISNIPDYADAVEKHYANLDAESQNQPGEVEKGVAIMVDLVRKEGVAEGKEVPFRFPLGTDCYEESKDKLNEMMSVSEEWKSIIVSTDHA